MMSGLGKTISGSIAFAIGIGFVIGLAFVGLLWLILL